MGMFYTRKPDQGFEFNEKAWKRSLMRPVPKIENELERMMAKTRDVPKEEMEGMWKFNGYFPRSCKAMPLCHNDQLAFTHSSKLEDSQIHKFYTKGTKTGPGCKPKDLAAKTYGTTWVRDSYMMFSNRPNAPKFKDQLETPFIFDKHPTKDRLFIRDAKVNECWIVYDRMN